MIVMRTITETVPTQTCRCLSVPVSLDVRPYHRLSFAYVIKTVVYAWVAVEVGLLLMGHVDVVVDSWPDDMCALDRVLERAARMDVEFMCRVTEREMIRK